MTRLVLALFLGLAAALLVSAKLGGALGGGVLAGYLLGSGLGGLGILWQRHVLLTRPEKAMQAVVLSFGAKLAALGLGAVAFRFVEAAAARADWRAFLISFAAAIALVVPLGALDAARALSARSAPPKSPAESPAPIESIG